MKLWLGTRKGLIELQRSQGRWTVAGEAHGAIPVSLVGRDPRNGTLWACLDHGHWGCKLQRSRDLGRSWLEVAAPRYPEGSEIRPGVPANLKYLWGFAAGGGDQPGRIYLGSEPGGLFRSDDEGDSFSLVESLWNQPHRDKTWFGGGRDEAGIHSILVDPRDSRRILVGVSCAGVFESCDDTLSWTPRNRGLSAEFLPDPDAEVGHDPHLLAWCAAHPDMLWQQNHCGIYRSRDGAKTWEAVHESQGPARFGFAIAVHERNPEVAWVVPATSDEQRVPLHRSLCVCRTQDGGKSWTALHRGLPQHDCYDLVYRHALALSGDCLAFGTTTGNLYFSEDGGESWECLGHHFPPVYSCCFTP